MWVYEIDWKSEMGFPNVEFSPHKVFGFFSFLCLWISDDWFWISGEFDFDLCFLVLVFFSVLFTVEGTRPVRISKHGKQFFPMMSNYLFDFGAEYIWVWVWGFSFNVFQIQIVVTKRIY